MENRLREKGISTALITGATSGIGLTFARTLASYGCNLVLVSNEAEKLPVVAAELTAGKEISVRYLYQDLSVCGAARQVYDYCERKGLKVDLLINNAGFFSFNEVTDTDPMVVDGMVTLHTLTVAQLCRLFAEKRKREGKGGYILNLSSLAAWMPFPGIALYSATKAFVRSFSSALHDELKESNIHVMALCPGGVNTDLYGLPPRLIRAGVRMGILVPSQQVVDKALNALFKGKAVYVPGWLSRIMIPLFPLIPRFVWRRINSRLAVYHR
ncbi:SDR family oxidoreductase [Porphyromonadaceae bacterium]